MRLHTTTGTYNDARYMFLRSEVIEGYRQYAYVDTRGVATIGIGFNLRTHQNLILQTFGFDINGTLVGQAGIDEQRYIEQIRTELNSSAHTTTSLQTALQAIMDARWANTNYPADFVKRPYFRFEGPTTLGEAEARGVFEQLMAGYTAGSTTDRGYEAKLSTWLTANNIGAVGDSRERIALLSLSYQGWINGATSSPMLARALRNDDRAEAYYEIAYHTNTEARRYREAALFGLYNINPDEADYKAAYRMFTRHKTVILGSDGEPGGVRGYEDNYPPPNGLGIRQQLNEAYTNLTRDYGQGNTDIAWNHIQVGETAGPGHPTGTDADTLTGTASN